MRIIKPEETSRLFEMKFDENKDAPLHLPIIAIAREKEIDILNTQKQPKTFSGFSLATNEEINIPINVIPMQLSYQIDIYTKGLIEADEYLRNFVFNFVNYPKVVIEVPYNDFHILHESIIHMDSTLMDNSDIREHLFADQFTRFTIKININDAYLFSVPVNQSARLELGELEILNRQKEIEEVSPIWLLDNETPSRIIP